MEMATKYLVCASCNNVVGHGKPPKHTWWGALICPVCDNNKFFETVSVPSLHKNENEKPIKDNINVGQVTKTRLFGTKLLNYPRNELCEIALELAYNCLMSRSLDETENLIKKMPYDKQYVLKTNIRGGNHEIINSISGLELCFSTKILTKGYEQEKYYMAGSVAIMEHAKSQGINLGYRFSDYRDNEGRFWFELIPPVNSKLVPSIKNICIAIESSGSLLKIIIGENRQDVEERITNINLVRFS